MVELVEVEVHLGADVPVVEEFSFEDAGAFPGALFGHFDLFFLTNAVLEKEVKREAQEDHEEELRCFL